MARGLVIAGALALVACAPTLRRPVETTEAATDLEQVTRSAQNEWNPAVSPDAEHVAFESAPNPDAIPRVDVASTRGGEVEYGSGEEPGVEPAWMPDGSGILFVSRAGNATTLVEMIGHGPGRAPFVADAADRYFGGEWPAFSPRDGRVVMSMGSVLAFQTGWRASLPIDRELALADLRGAGFTFLDHGTEPAWSPDGAHLAFARRVDGHEHLFVADADGSDARAITDGPDDDVSPTWSPDGARIAFCSVHVDDVGATRANLFTVRADGGALLQLTEGDRVACRPSWARDGLLYFHANAESRYHIWRLRPR